MSRYHVRARARTAVLSSIEYAADLAPFTFQRLSNEVLITASSFCSRLSFALHRIADAADAQLVARRMVHHREGRPLQ